MMKYLSEYRHPDTIKQLVGAINATTSKSWTIMEICGGQTHNIVKYGLDQLLPESIELVHGPGCPVCVTPASKIDAAIAIATQPNVIVCSYGDMLRVPGSGLSLLQAKTDGADVRVVYSPMDALQIARENPKKEVVFFSVGFETTAPANGMAIFLAHQQSIGNFSAIISHVLVLPAMKTILANPDCRIQGFLAAGHVCTIVGIEAYHSLAEEFEIPIVVTGFEPVDILEGVSRCVSMLEQKQSGVVNQYSRSVREAGNIPAQELLHDLFDVIDMDWRGIGIIARSGLGLKPKYHRYDAERRFAHLCTERSYKSTCQAGEILLGLKKPDKCPHFGRECHPDNPMGAPMVSSEGACAAYYQYSDAIEN